MKREIDVPQFGHLLPEVEEVRCTPPTIVAALLMVSFAFLTSCPLREYPKAAMLPKDTGSPGLAIQVPHSQDDLQTVLRPHRVEQNPLKGDWEPAVKGMFRAQLWWDSLGFIPSYGAFYLLLAGLLVTGRHRLLLVSVIAVMTAADWLENWRIFQVVDAGNVQVTDGMAHGIRLFALIKWGAFTVIQLWFSRLLARVVLHPLDRTITSVMAIVLFVAGIFGATGLNPEISIWALRGVIRYSHLGVMAVLAGLLPLCLVAATVVRFLGAPGKRKRELVPV